MKRTDSSLVYGTSSLGELLLRATPNKQLTRIQYFGCETGLADIAKQQSVAFFLELNHGTFTNKHILDQLPIAD